MKKDLPFKVFIVLLITISCTLLFVSVPVLIRGLFGENGTDMSHWNGFGQYKVHISLGVAAGIILSIFSLFQLDVEIQIKLVRFLLILGIMLTAITYVLIKSIS